MTKKDIANKINYEDTITRFISVPNKLNICVGDIFDNKDKCSSWQRSDRYKDFIPETNYKYKYKLECIGVPCHKVDYEDREECRILNCLNTDAECEVLVLDTAKMKIKSIEEIEENRYHICMEFIGFKNGIIEG